MCLNAVSARMCVHHVNAKLRQGQKGGTKVPGVGVREGWVPVKMEPGSSARAANAVNY